MTKQEEIRELLEMILRIAPVPMDDVKNVAYTILEMLKAKGVVIKVDPPFTLYQDTPLTAFEPLIEVKE